MCVEKNNQMHLITDTENLFEEKKLKLEEINLELNKDNYLFTNKISNNKIEEEEQEETLPNLSQEKKNKKEKILSLEIITSSYISKGINIKLTPEGYEKGIRRIKDGITYFGYEELDKNNLNNVSIFKY
jgi:hypothetical protein